MPPKSIRSQILKQRGITLSPNKRKVRTHDQMPTKFNKTTHMKFIEIQFSDSIEHLLKGGSNLDAGMRLGLDRSTVSKWRKMIRNGDE